MLARERHVWIATGGEDGAHLVPLACAWDGRRLVMATQRGHRTVRNILSQRRTRAALGTVTDVVLMDGETEVIAPQDVTDKESAILELLPMDPAKGDGRVYLFFTPRRIQTWRHRGEIADRTVMAQGRWLD
jgi:hypothetical protein